MITWENYRTWLGTNLVGALPVSAPCPLPAQILSDTRLDLQGQWFLALCGESFNGHDFIPEALRKGANGLIVQHETGSIPAQTPTILVRNSLLAWQQIAAGWRQSQSQVKVLALTGSAGKTTTKEMLATICSAYAPTLYSQKNYNNEIGLAQTLCQIEPKHRFVVVELGARHAHDIATLTTICQPDVAACLNIGTAHLGEFGSIEILARTKLEIFTESSANTICVYNADDDRMRACIEATQRPSISFGLTDTADCSVRNVQWLDDGRMSVQLSLLGLCFDVVLDLAHAAYPLNVAAACALAAGAGIPIEAMLTGLRTFKGVEHRYQVIRKARLTIIDDTYNANPQSMAAGLSTLAKGFASQRKIIVLGDMLELGAASDEAHRSLGAMCCELTSPELLITVGNQARLIAEGALRGGLARDKVRSYSDVNALIDDTIPYSEFGDVLYTKGSRGIGLVRFVQALEARSL